MVLLSAAPWRRWAAALTVLGVLALTAGSAAAHPTRGATATPRNMTGHPWSTDGCSNSPERGPGWDFHHACIHHDGCYRGHWAGQSTCDSWFLRDMRASCAVTSPRAGLLRSFCSFIAGAYHQAVRLFGASAYARGSIAIRLR
jgi:hypothetical protein